MCKVVPTENFKKSRGGNCLNVVMPMSKILTECTTVQLSRIPCLRHHHRITAIQHRRIPVMLSTRGQAGLEAKILSTVLDSALKNCPRPRAFVLGMSSNFLFWPRENECNDGTGNHCEFAMIIYQSYLLTYLVLLI